MVNTLGLPSPAPYLWMYKWAPGSPKQQLSWPDWPRKCGATAIWLETPSYKSTKLVYSARRYTAVSPGQHTRREEKLLPMPETDSAHSLLGQIDQHRSPSTCRYSKLACLIFQAEISTVAGPCAINGLGCIPKDPLYRKLQEGSCPWSQSQLSSKDDCKWEMKLVCISTPTPKDGQQTTRKQGRPQLKLVFWLWGQRTPETKSNSPARRPGGKQRQGVIHGVIYRASHYPWGPLLHLQCWYNYYQIPTHQ